ncbi:hypothetical protein BU16DRAFT_5068 [Lophium mytilinum]|uniref:Uncharacterized protein n=1 Tax=Lophium mytilinum TaxID=390894 RepID=A0A6A6RD60_9PEZI|nr:hypothetical protein BU16DRAFT_5068 [Lophium mytilinum]
MRTSSLLFSVLASLTFVAASPLIVRQRASFPNPEPCTGNCTGGIHDPSVIKRPDGKWYRLSTGGDIAIASAPSLTGPWEYLGAMLPGGPKIHVSDKQDTWVCVPPNYDWLNKPFAIISQPC